MLPARWIEAFLTGFELRVWALAHDPEGIVDRLSTAAIPDGTLPFAPADSLSIMRRIVWPLVRGGGGLGSYISMVRRGNYWRRYGRISDEQDDPELEAKLAAYQREIDAALPVTDKLVAAIDIATFIEQAVDHSQQCVDALLASGRRTEDVRRQAG